MVKGKIVDQDFSSAIDSLNLINKKVATLECAFDEEDQSLTQRNEEFIVMKDEFTLKFASAHAAMQQCSDRIRALVAYILTLKESYKDLARQDEIDALSKKVDIWKTTSFVSKGEIKKIVEQTMQDAPSSKRLSLRR